MIWSGTVCLTGGETVLDLYCGAGTIGLYLVPGGESNRGGGGCSSGGRCRRNAQLKASPTPSLYRQGGGGVAGLIKKYRAVDGAVVDPPRKGCDPVVLEALAKVGVPTLVYVSCNPATLARDLNYLAGLGYTAGAIQPVDMFPWTSHVESVCVLSKSSG